MRTFVGPIPSRISALPKDKRGFPVPFFVHWQDGVPQFPVVDPMQMRHCMQHGACWICGQRITAFKSFVIGPMCVVNRISSEPPSHKDCATFAARNCPFLAHPLAKRADSTGYQPPGGIMIERNPGVTCVWTTKSFTIERDRGHPLWRIGPAVSVEFYAKGRKATRPEVDESVRTGLPLLHRIAAAENGLPMLQRQVDAMTALLATLDWSPEPIPDLDLRAMYETPDEPRNFGNPDWRAP